MTVNELIAALNKIEDKDLVVCACISGIEPCETEIKCVEYDRHLGLVWLGMPTVENPLF